MEMFVLGLISDIILWSQLLWWLWLAMLAYFYYAWARDHLFFSPPLVLVVGGILIYYMVIEHPLFGSVGLVFYTLIFGGVLYLLPLFLPMFRKRQQ
ncbi:MAG: hypothetical protein ABH863_03445 [Candidatus Micrarchaeota archaeon]